MIVAFITTAIIGTICIVLGIFNFKGNIKSLHSYHTENVSEEDIRPFGKRIGIGLMTVGGSVLVFGILCLVAELAANSFLVFIGTGIMFVGMAVGLLICAAATKKYNKKIM